MKGTVKLVSLPRSVVVTAASSLYKGHRYPPEIIAHCVWLYHRFPLSFREVEELMLQRGVVVSYETIRAWCAKFGQGYANQLRRRRPRPGDKWHLDEVFVKINGAQRYLWRAVDQHGNVLDVLVPVTRAGDEALHLARACATVPVGVQRHLAALSAPSAPAVGGALPTGHGRPLRGLERDHRGDDHGRRLNQQLGQVFPPEPTHNTQTIDPNHQAHQLT